MQRELFAGDVRIVDDEKTSGDGAAAHADDFSAAVENLFEAGDETRTSAENADIPTFAAGKRRENSESVVGGFSGAHQWLPGCQVAELPRARATRQPGNPATTH